jgi:hypothetical protein
MNEHKPKNLTNKTLLTSTVPSSSRKYSIAHSQRIVCEEGNAGSVPAAASLVWLEFTANFDACGL